MGKLYYFDSEYPELLGMTCAICAAEPFMATPVGLYWTGEQAYVCDYHLCLEQNWMYAWADFRLGQDEQAAAHPLLDDVAWSWRYPHFQLVERRIVEGSWTKDLVQHLYTRIPLGPVLILCDRPEASLSAVRKRWLRSERLVQRLRASSLDAGFRAVLRDQLTAMQAARFALRRSTADADVSLARLDDETIFTAAPATVYLTVPIGEDDVVPLARRWEIKPLIVRYELAEAVLPMPAVPRPLSLT